MGVGWNWCELFFLNRVVRIGLIQEMIFVQRLEIVEGVSPVDRYMGGVKRKSITGRGNSQYKGPKVCSKEASMARVNKGWD